MESGKLIKPEAPPTDLHSIQLSYPAVPNYPAWTRRDPSLRDYWHVLLKRKHVILSCLIIVVSLTAIYTFRTTPLYQAVGRIAIYRENQPVLDFKDVGATSSDDWDYTVAMDTQVKILQSDSLAQRVAEDLQTNARKNPDSSGIAVENSRQSSREEEAALADRLRGNLTISTIPNTRMIEIRYWSADPQFAAKVVNAYAGNYIQDSIRTRYESTVQASEWLSKQLGTLQLKVETAQEKLVKYQKQNDILGIDEKQNIITAKLDDLNRNLTIAQTERIQKEANYRMTLTGNAELLAKYEPNSLIERLRAQESDLNNQYAQLSTQFGPSYPKLVEVSNQLRQIQAAIQAEVKKIAGKIQSEYLAAVQRERLLKGALEAQKLEANKLNERAIQYNLLKRDLDSDRQLYESLLQKLKEAGVSAALKSSNIRIVDSARVPTSPSKPDIPRNLVLGFLLGLTGGIALVFVLEIMDNTVHTPEQVELISSLPSLGIVPMSIHLERNGHHLLRLPHKSQPSFGISKEDSIELIAHKHPNSEIAESYRALRTSLLLSSLGTPPRVILVTSALPQEGKSTTSINCAIVLAQKGARVLLIDADLRRPSIHTSLGIKSERGLSALLNGSDLPENVIIPSVLLHNLFVLPAGLPPANSSELLGSNLMKEFLDIWREQFDHVVIDTPPVLSVTDAVALSVQADSVILVIRSGQTSKEALRRARELLLRVNAKLTGVVVNAVDFSTPELQKYYYFNEANSGSRYSDNATTRK